MPVDWTRIGPLPQVSPWRHGQRTLTWEQRRDQYASLPKTGLTIIAELATPLIHAERNMTHLDGILSSAAITDHPAPSKWDKVAIVPLPIDLLWVSPRGLPLWACTPLMVSDDAVTSHEYWHKRYPTDRADFGAKLSANTSSGRWREYRMPVAAQSASRLVALAIGHAAEVQRLLDGITHIGKKGSMGYGRVLRWSVVETAGVTPDDILSRRPVPVASRLRQGDPVPARGWTPPYWYAPHWEDCVG